MIKSVYYNSEKTSESRQQTKGLFMDKMTETLKKNDI